MLTGLTTESRPLTTFFVQHSTASAPKPATESAHALQIIAANYCCINSGLPLCNVRKNLREYCQQCMAP